MTGLQRRTEREEHCRVATQLCAGLEARVDHKVIPNTNTSVHTLIITKDGEPFTGYTIGATEDWMSGNFSISGRVVYGWDRGRRTKRDQFDNWLHHSKCIADTVNYFAKEAARIQVIRDSIMNRALKKRKKAKHAKC